MCDFTVLRLKRWNAHHSLHIFWQSVELYLHLWLGQSTIAGEISHYNKQMHSIVKISQSVLQSKTKEQFSEIKRRYISRYIYIHTHTYRVYESNTAFWDKLLPVWSKIKTSAKGAKIQPWPRKDELQFLAFPLTTPIRCLYLCTLVLLNTSKAQAVLFYTLCNALSLQTRETMKMQCYIHRPYCCSKSVSYYYIIETAIIFVTVIVWKAAIYSDWIKKNLNYIHLMNQSSEMFYRRVPWIPNSSKNWAHFAS